MSYEHPNISAPRLFKMPSKPKYVVRDGIICLQPELARSASVQLTVVSSLNDVKDAATAMQEATGGTVEIPPDVSQFIDELRAPTSSSENCVDLFEEISALIIENEIPLGLVKTLFQLKGYRLHFIVDDSGSMSKQSDV